MSAVEACYHFATLASSPFYSKVITMDDVVITHSDVH